MSFYRVRDFFSHKPWLVSLLIFVCIVVWIVAGMSDNGKNIKSDPENKQKVPLARVMYETFKTVQTAKKIELYGRTAPDKESDLCAEQSGRILALLVKKGDYVKKDQPIAQIDKADLESQLDRAIANLKVKEKEFIAAKSLKNRGLQGDVAYSSAQSAFIEAKSLLRSAELRLNHTIVRAPFDGVADQLFIEVGDFVNIGESVARIIDLSVLVVRSDLNERDIESLKLNQKARVRLVTGDELDGNIRYLSKVSSASTNTFPIEVEIPNLKQKFPAGMSAEVQLDLKVVNAIKVSSAMLALDKEGNLGVKILKDRIVYFVPIQLVKAEQDGVWLTGFASSVDIITQGQGFVRDGDKVIAIESSHKAP